MGSQPGPGRQELSWGGGLGGHSLHPMCSGSEGCTTHPCHTQSYHKPLVLHTASSCRTFTLCVPKASYNRMSRGAPQAPRCFPASWGPLSSIASPGPQAADHLSRLECPCYHPRLSRLLTGSHMCGLVVCGHTHCSKVRHTPTPTYHPSSGQAFVKPRTATLRGQGTDGRPHVQSALHVQSLGARDRKDEQERIQRNETGKREPERGKRGQEWEGKGEGRSKGRGAERRGGGVRRRWVSFRR